MNLEEPKLGWTLALRPGEWRIFSDEVHDDWDNIYAVCLVSKTPPLYGLSYHVCSPYIVACMMFASLSELEPAGWGWIHLDADTKDIIGRDLEEMLTNGQIDEGQWVYMTVLSKPFWEK